ncbi:MAG: serine hydrolase domain-containing protein [Candidatus Hodarchaeota archaeon]
MIDKEKLRGLISEIKDHITEGMTKFNIPGVSIGIIDKKGIIWAEGFGYTDKTKSREVNPNTLFFIGSLSKAYTATAFLLAVQEGLVKLDDPLIKYYPEFTWNSKFGEGEKEKITFRHLLTHRAGLQHFTHIREPDGEKNYTFEEYIQKISKSWQKYPVGDRHSYSYSNAGYDLVAYTLERITQMKFGDYVKKSIYFPLEMNSSVVGTKKALEIENRAHGHFRHNEYDSGKFIFPCLGAAAQYSSVNDMAKFLMMHLNEGNIGDKKFLDENLLEEMYKIHFAEENELSAIGMGFGVTKYRFSGKLIIGFFGDGDGCFNLHQFMPELGFGLLVQINQIDNTFPFVQEISNKVLSALTTLKLGESLKDITINEKIKLPNPAKVDKKLLRRLEGVYISRMLDVEIKLKGDDLLLIFQGTETVLTPHGDNIFSSPKTPYIRIVQDKKGRPKTLKIINSKGIIFIFDYDSGPLDEFGPNKEEWKKYLGVYRFNFTDFCLYSAPMIKNGHLKLITTMNSKEFNLYEYKDNIFFTADGQNIIFQKDRIIMPGSIWIKEDISVEKIKKLIEREPKNILVQKISLQEFNEILTSIGRNEEANEIKKIIEDFSV